ncbi:unnamed protein product [Didymodactylos carnosus]|uniref:Uncharacterized protein n=1 Tax=Didymodactylos carnosus TaxID=1234261 RepID=A0A814J9I9_9BILA|nr:unnamed protein product [Didymodactylos carnosus]CAF1035023.1 unnamed protein product [Didymodactylos carnosus]CAF3742922.1 unnamed protein product [Didymodactylos carnosus]CAF3805676.1 unnamed protein product [Didymodactylos carnosus]
MIMASKDKTDVEHKVGYGSGEVHVGKEDASTNEKERRPEAGEKGEEESHISGQGGREILGGTSSTRVLGESVSQQLNNPTPIKSTK